ncbi:hypothetical protein [Bradyrhizobium sp. cf659]|uniref:hypothetical protein n=1 Tax=Bradyrhizobium sp. cf659 TaxID=1761771 RepID=UPI0008E3F3C7|nr:hypothetical protein [Bradyrhizobium sp. cf659]SFH83765.1 hypothetical protein SAMN04487925_101717 [Bradyrhizobium sp. cf659]
MSASEAQDEYSKNLDAWLADQPAFDPEREIAEIIELLPGEECAVAAVSDKVTAGESDKVVTAVALSGPIRSREAGKCASHKVTGRKRRSDKKDKELLDRIRRFKLPSADAAEASFSSEHSPPALCVWDHASDRLKLACSTIALQVWSQPTSWTFNLTPEAEAKALAHPKGFTKSLALAFNRKLKDRLGRVPFYWFSVHVTKDGRAHLHGAIEGLDDLPGLAEIMRAAWGRWEGRGAAYQVDLNPQRCDDGWADYAYEGRSRARTKIGDDHTFYIPDEVRRRAEFIYGELRAMMMPTTTPSA